jgi:hypothetical protein
MERQIAKVVTHVKMDDEDRLDVIFWQSKTVSERLAEVVRLRRNYYTWLNGSFPEKMEKVVSFRHISNTDS